MLTRWTDPALKEGITLTRDAAREWKEEFIALFRAVRELESEDSEQLVFLASHPYVAPLLWRILEVVRLVSLVRRDDGLTR